MTLHRDKARDISFECDGCEDVLDTHTDDFTDARGELKAERWGTSKDPNTDDWRHYCPHCKAGGSAERNFSRWMD
jgi:hypothetical protein